MATRSRKKPVKRKPKTALPNRGLTTFGWVAAGLVGIGWAASDGRPARYVSNRIADVRQTVRPELAVDRVAALIRSEPKPRASSAPETPLLRSHQPVPEDRTGSIRRVPTPTPPRVVAAVGKPDEISSVPMPTKAPLLPLQAPAVEYALRQSRPATTMSTVAPRGEERHATRALAAHAAPHASSPAAVEIASGTSVVVLRSAGDWRYVHDEKSGTEGWVDGRFLAGQSMASDLAALSREDLTRGR